MVSLATGHTREWVFSSLPSSLQNKPLIPITGRECCSLPWLSSFEPPVLRLRAQIFTRGEPVLQALSWLSVFIPVGRAGLAWTLGSQGREGRKEVTERSQGYSGHVPYHWWHVKIKFVVKFCLSSPACPSLYTLVLALIFGSHTSLSHQVVSSRTAGLSLNYLACPAPCCPHHQC